MATVLSISTDTVIARTDGLMSAQVGDEVVMLHLDRNAYYDVDPIGAVIWQRLEMPAKVGDLVDWLIPRYEVDRETCLGDLVAFLSAALGEGVIRIVQRSVEGNDDRRRDSI
jgi:hypothetical protein